MVRRLAQFLTVAVTTLGVAASASADFVIDNFAAPATPVNYQITQLNTNPWDRSDAIAGGLNRATHVEVVSPLPPTFNAVGGTLGAGAFSADTNNSTNAYASLTYTGFNATTGNFSGTNGIALQFLNLNPGNLPNGPVAPDMPVTIAISTIGGTMSYTAMVTGFGLPFTVYADYAGFTGTGDLSQVTQVQVTFNDGQNSRVASDYIIDEIKTTTVPAPPALFLIAAAVPVMGIRRWMVKRKVALAV